MSPKSRGRPQGRGRPKPRRSAPPREIRPSDRLLQEARARVAVGDVVEMERWASDWLGQVWSTAPLGVRDAEHQLCMEVVGRACTHPSPHAMAAVAALRRVAPESEHPMLDETVEILAESQPLPVWHGLPAPRSVRAWRAVDVWDSERVLFVEFAQDGPDRAAYTLTAQIQDVSGTLVTRLGLLQTGSAEAWNDLHEPDQVPMPAVEADVGDVLADLADALRTTDMTWPRPDDPDVVELRALAWARCRSFLPGWPEVEPTPDEERDELIQAFLAHAGLPDETLPDVDVTTSLADLFLDYGDGYLHSRPLGWSPTAVMLFLVDWLPRKVSLDVDQRAALPETLRRWLSFALTLRGVPQEWITPVVAAVDEHLSEFAEAFDDEGSWGPAKQIAAELAARGVDLTDRAAVDGAIRELNAERLAHRLLEP